MPPYFGVLIDPYDNEEAVKRSEADFAKIDCQKKLMLAGPAHLERPFRSFHNEILRWHDHWLKGLNTGIMDEPPVKFWVRGANEWRTAQDWPLPQTQWTKLYLRSWERLASEP